MLKGILRGRTLMQGSVTGMAWNLRFGLGEDGSLSAADSARTFTAEPNTSYRMILMYPNGSVDKNQLLFAVAAYNFANFMVKEFDLTFEEAGPMSMLNISGFNGINEILQYYKMIYGKDGYAQALDKNVAILPISDDNYETLMRGKTLEEYINFFEENYGEEVPELAARWKHRMEAEEEKTEEAAEEEQQPEEIRPEEETEEPVRREEVLDTLSVQPVIPETVTTVTPQDSVPAVQAPEEKELTLKEIEAIRKREAEEEAARKKVAREEFEAQQKAEKNCRSRKPKSVRTN